MKRNTMKSTIDINLEYRPRQSGKTTELFNFCAEEIKKGKEILFITFNESWANNVRKHFCYNYPEYTNRVRVISSCNTYNHLQKYFGSVDVIVMDEFDMFKPSMQNDIIEFIESKARTLPKYFKVRGYSSMYEPKYRTFRDICS